MTLPRTVRHAFVDLMPSERETGVVYISMKYSTAVHDCLCGCGMKVVTPIRPDKWTLTYDGAAISLSPSIGNWSFPCKSHYWIRAGSVTDAGPMPQSSIEFGRARDAALTERYHGTPQTQPTSAAHVASKVEAPRKRGLWARLFGTLR
jgi:hypothetical protein